MIEKFKFAARANGYSDLSDDRDSVGAGFGRDGDSGWEVLFRNSNNS